MKNILSNPNQFNLEAPIAHVINRHPDFISYGDASLEAAGGFSRDLFWWHIEWPDQIKSLTLKKIIVTRKCLDTDKLVSINLLEFIVEIINYIAITQLYKEEPKLCSHSNPLLMNWTDNTTALSWLRKAATRTDKGRSLQHLLCSLMINNAVGIKADHIAGSQNVLADAISRVYTSSYSKHSFKNLFQEFPQMKSWKRFHPSQELLSLLYSILLEEQDQGLWHPKNLGHFAPGNNIL